MKDHLAELARRIQGRPWNRPGTDKSWVLYAMWEHERLRREVHKAQGVGAR